MQALRVVPKVFYFDTFKEFNEEFKLGKKDIIVTNEWMYTPYVAPLGLECPVIYQEKFGKGEPSDEMINAMCVEMKKYDFDRIIAFGGGTIVDICKVLCLDVPAESVKLFTGEVPLKKLKELIVVPTTCGTGSEVTNVAIAELKSLHTKKGIAAEETYADTAVLIPESLQGLPDFVFATSSIDALIHAIESYLSPKASPFTEMYSLKAIEMIMDGYKKILAVGNTKESRTPLLKQFMLASNYAGIA
ncbi:MAG: iron-containing alcohol dehydrogenase, partial [Anaerovorax sp.]